MFAIMNMFSKVLKAEYDIDVRNSNPDLDWETAQVQVGFRVACFGKLDSSWEILVGFRN